MIFIQTKRYRITLWEREGRSGATLSLEFDNLADAERAFEQKKAEGSYQTGILFEWRKQHNDWLLLRRYRT